jgi:hypothetical protein
MNVPDLPTSPALLLALSRAAKHEMTSEEIDRQRASWVRGMCCDFEDGRECPECGLSDNQGGE